MSDRPDIDVYFMMMACVAATRTSCVRKAVGCVLVDARRRVLATGYNGVAAGQPHCNEQVIIQHVNPPLPAQDEDDEGDLYDAVIEARWRPFTDETTYPRACPGAFLPSGGTGDGCGAIHAEINALVQCRDAAAVVTAYLTDEPCGSCTKALLATSIEHVVFLRPHGSSGLAHWVRSGRDRASWRQLDPTRLPPPALAVLALAEPPAAV